MDIQEKKGGNIAAICMMFALFFMIAFVTNLAGSMGPVLKNQFGASDGASQFGSAANFFAYLFMGIPGGLILKRRGYKFTSLLAIAIGIAGLGVQVASAFVESFSVYVAGAFIAGFSMCLLNLVVNPLLNTLGGEGKKGNQLVQFGCTLNSVGATLAPWLAGKLIGDEIAKAKVMDAAVALYIAVGIFLAAFIVILLSKIPEPHMETAQEKADRLAGKTSVIGDIIGALKFRHFTLGAVAIFLYIIIESGIPNFMNLYMTSEGTPGYVGAAVAGSLVAAYWFCMMVGRLIGGSIGSKVSSRAMIVGCSVIGIGLMLATMYTPLKMVTIFGKTFPLAMCFGVLCGLCTSVMWGGIFNMAAEGLGRFVPMGSGIFMAMVFGGMLLPVQGAIASRFGYLQSYWMTIGLFAYVLFYALIGSRISKKCNS